MIYIKSEEDLKKMRESGRILAQLLQELKSVIKPGISTWDIDHFAAEYIRKNDAIASFKGYIVPGLKPYPAAVCTSINSCIVHGIPSKEAILQDGDIIGVDAGVGKFGFHTDSAYTYAVGVVRPEALKLMEVTQKALQLGIQMARVGNRIGDISNAIGSYVEREGYFVADDLTGHGIGRDIHEDPMIPNVGHRGRGVRLQKGMTIAIEPMVNIGTNRVKEVGWEFHVQDDTLSAHFEHTIVITDNEPEILTKC